MYSGKALPWPQPAHLSPWSAVPATVLRVNGACVWAPGCFLLSFLSHEVLLTTLQSVALSHTQQLFHEEAALSLGPASLSLPVLKTPPCPEAMYAHQNPAWPATVTFNLQHLGGGGRRICPRSSPPSVQEALSDIHPEGSNV